MHTPCASARVGRPRTPATPHAGGQCRRRTGCTARVRGCCVDPMCRVVWGLLGVRSGVVWVVWVW